MGGMISTVQNLGIVHNEDSIKGDADGAGRHYRRKGWCKRAL